MIFNSYLLGAHAKEISRMLEEIKKEIELIEDKEKQEDLYSAIGVIENYNTATYKCVGIYSKCEKELVR